jgi:hypothetical protein
MIRPTPKAWLWLSLAATVAAVVGCTFGLGEHRGYTAVAIRRQTDAIRAEAAQLREYAVALDAETATPEELAETRAGIDAGLAKIETRADDAGTRADVMAVDVGYYEGVDPKLGSDEDRRMRAEHAGWAAMRDGSRTWKRKAPERITTSVINAAADAGDRSVRVIAARTPLWIRIALWALGIFALVTGIMFVVTWLRERWYKAGVDRLVVLAHRANVGKDALREATAGTAAQERYRLLRARGLLDGTGEGVVDAGAVDAKDEART